MAEPPEIRVGTAEREQALNLLSEHFSAGRLSVAEFDERSAVVTTATTKGQLDSVFTDLPAVVGEASAPAKKDTPGWDWRATVIAVTPIVALILFFTVGSWLWFLLIPAVPAILEGGRRVTGD